MIGALSTTFVLVSTVKIVVTGGFGLLLASGMRGFHNFEFKKSKGGGKGESVHIESLREKSRSLN